MEKESICCLKTNFFYRLLNRISMPRWVRFRLFTIVISICDDPAFSHAMTNILTYKDIAAFSRTFQCLRFLPSFSRSFQQQQTVSDPLLHSCWFGFPFTEGKRCAFVQVGCTSQEGLSVPPPVFDSYILILKGEGELCIRNSQTHPIALTIYGDLLGVGL